MEANKSQVIQTYSAPVTRVLVVDDDEMLRTLIRIRLKKKGYTILEAIDGSQAIELFEIERPEIILMDANMPGMDGYEAASILRNHPDFNETRLLMISGLEDDESVDRAFLAGATEYITKPICWPLLIHRLANICAGTQAESDIIKAKNEADLANKSKSEFLANMSHELRTPMHAILSFASMGLAKVNTAPTDKLERYFSRIDQSGKRLLHLLNDLLDLSKLEAGAMSCEFKSSDILKVVHSVQDELVGLIDAKGINFYIETPQTDTFALFDAERIFQVLRNLISNAIKFTDKGEDVCVIIGSESNQNVNNKKLIDNSETLCISVLDQGIGIPEAELSTIFDKFVQSSNTKTGAGGTGLGLSICKEIIEQHNGKIWAENNPECGTSFHFTLPINPD